ncbi:IS1096 element passenger TnpR family protein [Rhodopirellula halodulae]|uniref:IS1096 element passenger TnpR family protein n=1 Tax=Rhodopirellula halodulae TaxID=2894198 RepID=UPI0034D661ED
MEPKNNDAQFHSHSRTLPFVHTGLHPRVRFAAGRIRNRGRVETLDAKLANFHEAIQTAICWTTSHLHAYEIGRVRYTDPRMLDNVFPDPSEKRTASVQLFQQAKTVLSTSKHLNNEPISEQVDLIPQQVSVCRKRWRDNWQRLISVECSESLRELKRQIETLLADLPRPVMPSCFTAEQQAAIVSNACEDPRQWDLRTDVACGSSCLDSNLNPHRKLVSQ